MKQRRFVLAALFTVGLLAVGGVWTIVSAQQAGTNWRVFAGLGMDNQAAFSNDFQPRPLEINVGDTITFVSGGFHTVAMGRHHALPFDPQTGQPNPVAAVPTGGNTFDGTGEVDSGFLPAGQEFIVTFTAPGTFRIHCDIHEGMHMDLTVQPAGTALPRTPAEAVAAAIEHFLGDFTKRVIPLMLQASQVTSTTTADGAVVHQVSGGTGDGHVEVIRFLPQSIVIRAGDTVRWVNSDPVTPHTVTFLPGGALPDPEAGPPPPEALPPGFPFAPAGGNVFSGGELINSGALFNDPRFQAVSVGDMFDVRFTTPGTFQYFCAFHVADGMVGTVVVLPAGGK